MNLVIDLPAWHLPFVAIGAGFLTLAVWLLVLDFPSRLNRAFALYLFLDGAPEFARLFAWTTPDGYAIRIVSTVMSVTAPFALIYFMLAYEERFGSRQWRERALVPLLVASLLLAGAVLYEPAWYFRSADATAGPLRLVASWLHVLTPSIAAFAFGREATRHASDSQRQALLLASLAFAAGPLFSALHWLVPDLMGGTVAERVVRLVALLPLGLLVAHMARVARRPGAEALQREARRFLAVLTLPVASVLLLAGAPIVFGATAILPFVAVLWMMSVMMSVWMLALPLLVTYALVRHRLFDIDVKIRWGLSRGTIAAAFVAVFFIASEAAQQFFGETIGSTYLGIAAAGALVFAIAPLQRAAERLAEKAVPAASDPPRPAGRGTAAQEVAYQAAVRLALRGGITRAEELDLARIAEAHGLSHLRARELRNEIEDAWTKEESP